MKIETKITVATAILLVVGFYGLWKTSGSAEPAQDSSWVSKAADASIAAQAAKPVEVLTPDEQAKKNVVFLFNRWNPKEGFDTIWSADITVQNNNDFAVKDLEIGCVYAAPSGTWIDQTEHTEYRLVGAHQRWQFRHVTMGFVNTQAYNGKCALFHVTAVDAN